MPGLACGSVGGVMLAYLVFARLFLGESLSDRPMLMFAFILILIGVQFILFGLIGEMQTRTYHESQNKPIYHVRHTVGVDDDKKS